MVRYCFRAVSDLQSIDSTFIFDDGSLASRLPEMEALLQNGTAPATFRFTDLPEELQAQIFSFCITDWSYLLTNSRRVLPSDYACFQIAHPDSTKANSNIHDDCPWTTTSIQLVNHHLKRLLEAESLRKFTGCMYIDPTPLTKGPTRSPEYCGSPWVSNSRWQDLYDVHKSIVTVHCGAACFDGFELDVLNMLCNLKVVVIQCNGTLFDGNIYGFGEEVFFVRVVSAEKLKDFMLAQLNGWNAPRQRKLEQIWQLGSRTVVEMTVAMGSPPMKFEFICVFLLREDADPVVLGKFTMQEWGSLVQLRMSVYNKTA